MSGRLFVSICRTIYKISSVKFKWRSSTFCQNIVCQSRSYINNIRVSNTINTRDLCTVVVTNVRVYSGDITFITCIIWRWRKIYTDLFIWNLCFCISDDSWVIVETSSLTIKELEVLTDFFRTKIYIWCNSIYSRRCKFNNFSISKYSVIQICEEDRSIIILLKVNRFSTTSLTNNNLTNNKIIRGCSDTIHLRKCHKGTCGIIFIFWFKDTMNLIDIDSVQRDLSILNSGTIWPITRSQTVSKRGWTNTRCSSIRFTNN